MLKFYVALICIIIRTSGVLGTCIFNHSSTTRTAPISTFLGKFHQDDFKMIYERIELGRSDKRYADCQFITYKYNRTTPVSNGSCIFYMDLGYAAEIIVQAYRFASNEYREFPVRFQMNYCDAVSSCAFGLDSLVRNGNVVCPILKGKKYYSNNFTPDQSMFPPFIPNGHYKLELEFWYQDKEMFVINGYGIVERPISIPDS